ncbi:MAG: chitobiase/beta-hexosaminidase C-terminal domain-containing protein, partial [Candidatus Poribacteria bacterium]|nr:chitobiase/beta-hexosaminidase C-terminal domain-containing protein [Candidatus Poribacteria bacterium]
DGLLDGEEANTHKTDYNKKDTDGDGLNDKVEIIIGSNPLDQFSTVPSDGTPIILVNGEVVVGKHFVAADQAEVEIKSAFEGGMIFYTLDGGDPSSGNLYTGPFTFSESKNIRAIAFSSNFTETVEATFGLTDEELERDSSNRYSVVSGSFDWEDARDDAVARGGHLATITSKEEIEHVAQNINLSKYGSLWLGADDMDNEGKWEWVTGEDWLYENWAGGEPNNCCGGEHYLEIYQDGSWNDISPSRKSYILEIEKKPRGADIQIIDSFEVKISTAGSGTVTIEPKQDRYLDGTKVKLTVTPAEGWQFMGWKGDARLAYKAFVEDFDSLPTERQGRKDYYIRERPRLSEIEVWGWGDNLSPGLVESGGSIG